MGILERINFCRGLVGERLNFRIRFFQPLAVVKHRDFEARVFILEVVEHIGEDRVIYFEVLAISLTLLHLLLADCLKLILWRHPSLLVLHSRVGGGFGAVEA